ncbi:MAG: DUF58 domain-containing protein [Gammaproteobacteria bacterium]|nr:DUF58 domain-containing protein [Gammaproteobacteria bacterium]
MRLARSIRESARRWAQRRQGIDNDTVVLHRRRVYILPTQLGVAYALMLLAMLLGSMNYGSSLGLALTFLLAGLGLVAMHHCHRNLVGLKLTAGDAEPVFAGQAALFPVTLESPSRGARFELQLECDEASGGGIDLAPGARSRIELPLPTNRRGALRLERYSVRSTFPLGLFCAWAWLHVDRRGIVFPRPARPSGLPPPRRRDTGGAQNDALGDEDFAGLRGFRPGDSPRHVAWKAFAREHELLVKQYAGTAVEIHWFAWDRLPAVGVEERLAQLCRWILDAHAGGHAFGLELRAARVEPGVGNRHRQHCLTLLALFDE